MSKEVNILALVKLNTGEKYVFIYTDNRIPEMLSTVCRFADHPDLSFTEQDALVVASKMGAVIINFPY